MEIRRSASCDVTVVAVRDLAGGELTIVPIVPLLNFIFGRKTGAGPAANAVALPPRDGSEPLVISPCTRLPPRGALLQEWGKEAFASPCWLMERSSNPLAANCSWAPVTVRSVNCFECGSAPLDLGTAMTTVTASHEEDVLYVLTNHKAVKTGDDLIMEGGDVAKRARPGKAPQWHDTVAKRAKGANPT